MAWTPASYSETYEAEAIPWSGYWWPFTAGGLATGNDYRGHPAPLEKYELLTEGHYPGQLTTWYKERYYDPDAPRWYGFCAYWAWSSVYERYEIYPSSEDNIIFRVGDKKGLLSLVHNRDVKESAGAASPDVFHYWLLNYIKDQKAAFVADLDGGEEVWSYPIFKYDMESTRTSSTEWVSVKIYYTDDMVPPDYMGSQINTATYTYKLYLNGGQITDGEWTDNSIEEHPEKLTFPLMQNTDCPYIDYERVVEIAQSKDDFLESADRVEINPGTYNLVLLNEDVYRIACLADDNVALKVKKQDGSSLDISVAVVDGDVQLVHEAVVDDENSMDIIFNAGNPPYTIHLTQTDYTDPNIYTLVYDVGRDTNHTIPFVPKNGMWSGFSLTNPHDEDVGGVMLVTYNDEGGPIQTVLGPLTLKAGEKRVFFFDDLSVRRHELGDTEKMRLIAEQPVVLLNLIGKADELLSCFSPTVSEGTHLVLPDTVPPMTPGVTLFGSIENPALNPAQVFVDLYSAEGHCLTQRYVQIDGHSALPIVSGNYPFYTMPDSGWIDIRSAYDETLTGYQYRSSGGMAETVCALKVSDMPKIVPHIPPPGLWTTTATLINPNDAENRLQLHLERAADSAADRMITLAPYEKRILELQNDFGKQAGDPLYHSILTVHGDLPFAGTYAYQTDNGEATFPLVEITDCKAELVLPHYPGSGGIWWTGFGVFNSNDQMVTVAAEPFDRDGNRIDDETVYIDLAPGAYEIKTVRSVFGEAAGSISFVKFRMNGAEKIGGFYLYGNLCNTLLSGSNM